MFCGYGWLLAFPAILTAADLPGSKDPAGMKRYEGSEIIGYREPKFDEYLLPLGPPTELSPPKYARSLDVDGQVSRYTYIAPANRTATELLRNYKLEFERLGLQTLYEKKAGERGWFGPTFDKIAEADGLSQILAYNEADERLLVGKSRDAKPTYYVVFVTAYRDGVIPERLQNIVQKGRAIAQLVVIAPDSMERKMTFVNADQMKNEIQANGKVVLYGILFDTDKEALKPESQPAIAEIVKLLKADPSLRIHVVGHTDNQGKTDYNLDLSKRRAASVVSALTAQGISPARLDAFGCGVFAPVASNETEEGRAKNRRVELTRW
ncbi:MAG TPA: OmpA family protein [Bryobacteraceae bacterium]|nr:OmpA family protein [Bryobacteraceae bacterium]